MSPDIAQCLLGRGQVTPIENHCPRWLEVLLYAYYGASLVPQLVKHRPAVRETWLPSLGREDPLEKGMATHSSILAWRILGTEEPGGLQSRGSRRVGQDRATDTQRVSVLVKEKSSRPLTSDLLFSVGEQS